MGHIDRFFYSTGWHGVDASHPDLREHVNKELSESFVPGFSALEDPVCHGTHIAGIIGAEGNNRIGVAGVFRNVEIVSLRVIGDPNDKDNATHVDNIVTAIQRVNEKGIHMLSISLGVDSSSYSDDFKRAISIHCRIWLTAIISCPAHLWLRLHQL